MTDKVIYPKGSRLAPSVPSRRYSGLRPLNGTTSAPYLD